jgi:hypothetical protein
VTTIYTDEPTTIKAHRRHHHDVETIIALAAEQRTQLKTIITLCREIERDRHADARDKRRAIRIRHAHSDMLAASRAGAR